ncbi:MAG: hypothetical protein L3J28_09535 [Candidatus Polarisedimenticolaceae bacterium]|nr:hypothetical protein [Candidatus Polarisedimenticolaceae bacterium]
MRFDFDWVYLRSAVATTAISLVLGLSLLLFSFNYLTEAEEQREETQRNLYSLTSKYQKARRDKHLINDYLVPYRRLVQMGMVGKEDRLNWVDTLRASVQALQVPRMQFQFSPQQRFDKGIMDAGSQLVVYSSRMKLDVGLLHEIDLLRLVAELERQIPALFTVDSCSINPVSGERVYTADQHNLNVRCDLLWFTIDSGHQMAAMETGP